MRKVLGVFARVVAVAITAVVIVFALGLVGLGLEALQHAFPVAMAVISWIIFVAAILFVAIVIVSALFDD